MERVGIRVEPFSTYLERGRFNEIYVRYFPEDQPARIFLCVPAWPGPFDIEIDCIAVA